MEVYLKPEQIDLLRNGLEREKVLYSRIREISKKENKLLEESQSMNLVFASLPEKMAILNEISELDDSIKDLKEEWAGLKQSGENLPSDIVLLLKNVEEILLETIDLDEKNKGMMVRLTQKPVDFHQNNVFRAKKAYGQ